MKLKKNPEKEVGRNSSLYFAVGLNFMLFITWFGLEYKTPVKSEVVSDVLHLVDNDIKEDIPIANLNVPPPPPPPPSVAVVTPEIIQVVADIEEVEEAVLESTETNQSERIEEREVVAVEDTEVEEVEEDVEVPFTAVEKVPVFPGCKGNNKKLTDCFREKLKAHIIKNLKYPKEASELGHGGRVMVMFVVNKQGTISKVRTRAPYKSLEKEARRIIELLPRMAPAKQRNTSVSISYVVPIVFSVQD